MPTPVKTAKQCLNNEASHALDEAVSLTRRRGHAQTTSLHAVSAFLCLSPSQLREACIRAKNAAFYSKVQLKALDFCLSVSLDRLPMSQPRVDEPSISNSLMAAIKRSQANQRRHPDSLITIKNHQVGHHCNQEQLGNSCSSSGVKVELQHLIVSILDDPIVTRVFNDAGFSSFDVKLALLRPLQSYFRYPPSVFGGYLDPGGVGFRFPFSEYGDEEGDYRRIGEVLVKKKGRNPLLVGVTANSVLKGFEEVLERKKGSSFLPMEVHGINVFCIEKDVLKFVNENWSIEAVSLRLREIDLMVEKCSGPGLIVSFGNLRCFLGSSNNGYVLDLVNCVVKKLTKLLEIHDNRVWLIGSAANDQMYMEFLHRFPSIDNEWNLQPLPITSVRPALVESCFKSSLMGSFVPLGGFFSSPDVKCLVSSSCRQNITHSASNERFEEERTSVLNGGRTVSVTDKQQTTLSPCLQLAKQGAKNMLDDLEAKEGKVLLSAPEAVLQRNPGNLCQSQNHSQPSPKADVCQNSFLLSTDVGFHCLEEKVENINNGSTCTTSGSCKQCDYGKIKSCTPIVLEKHCQSKRPVFLSAQRTDHPPTSGSSSPYSLCISGVDDGQTSPSSVISVATNLELFSQPLKQQKAVEQSTNNSSEAIFKALFGRVGRQCEVLRLISQIVAHSWADKGTNRKSGRRGDLWMNFTGPDIFGKRTIALALAEILYGNKKNFIHIDLCSRDVMFHQKRVFGYPIVNGSKIRSRGKTVVDHIVEELCKTPSCVVLFENVNYADPLLQRSLLQAVKDGRFSDSYGKEVATNNRIFVLTSNIKDNNSALSWKAKPLNFPEERIERAKGWPLQILVKDCTSKKTGKNYPSQIILNKRKLNGTDEKAEQYISTDHIKQSHRKSVMSLDLNLPAETIKADDANYVETAVGHMSETSDSWVEDFSGQLSKLLVKLVFDPLDYDALATKLLKLVHEKFNEVIEPKCLLQVEPRVLDQIIAAACLANGDKEVEHWIDRVLSKGFAKAQKRYQLTVHSTVMISICEALYVEEQVQEAYLPSKISVT
ncbi:hypothetical protein BVRB_2g023680 [Beta vulgaris subsp. vulgaris]|nr:hypothetical protein BVRB_2g023680 [Beta vulgaris subsp. vulgaris]